MLFEEIKNKHEGGGPGGESGLFGSLTEEEISFYGLDRGSFDNGDPHTTNLYIGNLNPTTTGTATCPSLYLDVISNTFYQCRGGISEVVWTVR